MREFRIKVNNEKTYVVKANDYNQAVKTLHSKLRDFDDTKKNINVVREFITNNGGKFSKSKDADAILDFIYKKTGVKNADYGDVLYIIRNYTNVKVEDNTVTDFDLTNFLALKRSLELRIGEEIDFDKLEEYVNKLPKDKNGKKNIDVKEVIKRCIKAKDNAVSDSISRYTGEDAIRTNGFVKIKEDGDLTSYKYNGSDFDGAVFKIHQYNPSLIAFVSNGNRTITVRNKYLKDSSITDTDMKTAEDIIRKYGGNPVGNVMGLQKTRFVGQDEIKNQHDFATDLDKAGYKFYLINGRYRISPKDSSIKDVDWDFANKLKQHSQEEIRNALKYSAPTVYKQYRNGETIQFAGLAGQLTGPEKTKVLKRLGDSNILSGYKYRITNNGSKWYYETTFPDGHTTLTGPYSSKQETEQYFHKHRPTEKLTDANRYNKGQKFQTSAGIHEIIGYDPVKADANTNRIEYSYRIKTPNGTYTNIPDWQLEELVKLGRYKLIDSDIKDSDSYQVWTINEKGVYHKEADVPNPQLAKAIASQLKKQGRWVQISKNSRTNIVSDCDMMDSLSIKVKLNGKTYKGIFNGISNADKTLGDVYIPELVSLHSGDKGVFNPDEGHYVSDGKFYFKMENIKKWNPSLKNYLTDSNITDADPVKVEKIIRKEKSALGVTYYIFQTKSSSGYTIYYQVTDKTYHGEPTYSGGGIISFSLQSANDTLDHNLLMDKLKAKYGEKEGTKRYLRGENDSAIKDSNIKDAGFDAEYAEHQRKLDAEVRRAKELHKVNGALDYTTLFKQVFNYKSRGDRLTQLTKTVGDYTYVIYLNNNRILYCVWDKSGNIPKGWCPTVTMYDEYTIKDSNNIKNRKSYTIKVGDKQYKVFAESESEAINKYIKSKKQ